MQHVTKEKDWIVDLRRKTATHRSGFTVFVTRETGAWMARRSNAEEWAKEDFMARAPQVPKLLRAAVAAYSAASDMYGEKRQWNESAVLMEG